MNISPPIREGQKEKYDSVVLLPAYNEDPHTIGEALDAIEKQIGLDCIQTAVIVIINNARDASREILAMNQYALDEIQGDRARRRWPRLQEHLFIVDASSGEHALERCNVGVASTLAANIAIPLAKKTGILHRTDADSTLNESFLLVMQMAMKTHTDIGGITGPVVFVGTDKEKERMAIYTMCEQCKSPIEREKFSLAAAMPGAHLSIRKSDYERVGGFLPIAGSEDTRLSYALLSSGQKIGYLQEAVVTTSLRLSNRTDPKCGQGQAMISVDPFIEVPENALTWSPEHRSWFTHHVDYLSQYSANRTAPEWEKILSDFTTEFRCTNEEIHLLAAEIMSLPISFHPLENILFVKKLKELTEQRYQKMPLHEAVPAWRAQIIERENTSTSRTILLHLDPHRLRDHVQSNFGNLQMIMKDIEAAMNGDACHTNIITALECLNEESTFLTNDEKIILKDILLYMQEAIPKIIIVFRTLMTLPLSIGRVFPDTILQFMRDLEKVDPHLSSLEKMIDNLKNSCTESDSTLKKMLEEIGKIMTHFYIAFEECIEE